jgi:hypothetical protein
MWNAFVNNSSYIRRKLLSALGGFGAVSHCPAPSIGDASGYKHADGLNPAAALAKAGRVSACSGRVDDAQGSPAGAAEHGLFFWFVFFHVEENEQ